MARLSEIIYEGSLSRFAKTIIDLAKKENGQRPYTQQSEYDKMKEIYLQTKVDFLTKGDYDFSYKTCTDVTDVSENVDKLGYKYVYRVANDEPIIGVRDIVFQDQDQVDTPYITNREALRDGKVISGRYAIEIPKEVRFYYNQANDLVYTNEKIDTAKVTIKFFVSDADLPPEVVSVLKYYMAHIISADDIHRRDFTERMYQKHNEAITTCEKYRDERRSRRVKTSRDEWIEDIVKARGV